MTKEMTHSGISNIYNKEKQFPRTLRFNQPRTINLNRTIQKWPTSQIKATHGAPHFPRITTPPSNGHFSPFRFPYKRTKAGGQMLDPILVSTEMGHSQRNGPRQLEAHNKNRAGTRTSESTRCKGRRGNKEDGTLKTLERALHSHQSYCLPTFRFLLYRTRVYHFDLVQLIGSQIIYLP